MAEARRRALEQFGVELEHEVELLGRHHDSTGRGGRPVTPRRRTRRDRELRRGLVLGPASSATSGLGTPLSSVIGWRHRPRWLHRGLATDRRESVALRGPARSSDAAGSSGRVEALLRSGRTGRESRGPRTALEDVQKARRESRSVRRGRSTESSAHASRRGRPEVPRRASSRRGAGLVARRRRAVRDQADRPRDDPSDCRVSGSRYRRAATRSDALPTRRPRGSRRLGGWTRRHGAPREGLRRRRTTAQITLVLRGGTEFFGSPARTPLQARGGPRIVLSLVPGCGRLPAYLDLDRPGRRSWGRKSQPEG